MEKILKYLYYFCLVALIFGVLYLSTAMYLSPRQDVLNRGFIPCTKQLVFELSGCQKGKIGCPLKLLWQDMKCNIKVVGNGFKNWVAGNQPAPWSNYLFEPEMYVEDEKNPYIGDIKHDISDLNEQHDFILKKHQELEAAKQRYMNLDTNVLISDPEMNIPSDILGKPAPVEIKEESGDISAEADMDELPATEKNDNSEKGMNENEK